MYDYLRAVLAVNEVSQRALDLTTEAITGNQARPERLFPRRRVAAAPSVALLHADGVVPRGLPCGAQLLACHWRRTAVALLDPLTQANYTAWRHRWRCVLALGCLENELAYTERLAEGNSKNYQLWCVVGNTAVTR